MPSEKKATVDSNALAAEHVSLASGIAARLHRLYSWVAIEDLHSYAYLGLALAAKAYQDDRGVPFPQFAWRKGMFLAIDEMRKDGVLSRRRRPSSLTCMIRSPRTATTPSTAATCATRCCPSCAARIASC